MRRCASSIRLSPSAPISARTNFSGLLTASQFMASLNVPAWYNSSFSPLTISQVPTCSGNTTMVFSFNSPWSRAFCK
ncbi:hypothetical protein D3C80_1859490 [compost metagenome]